MAWSLVIIKLDSLQFGKELKQNVWALKYWSRDMLKFEFLGKSVGLVFLSHFMYYFSRKKNSHVMLF